MKDIIEYILENLPRDIEYEGINASFELLINNSYEMKLCYDIKYVSNDSPHKKQWDECGCWEPHFYKHGCISFLYLYEGIESLEDLTYAVEDCSAFLKKHKIINDRNTTI